MTGQMTLEPTVVELSAAADRGVVQCSHLSDGKLVRLSGVIGEDELAGLRLALLTPLPDGCRDVVVDAGDVEEIDDAAVAVLVAAHDWSERFGARLLLSRSADALDRVLDELDMAELLPRLGTRPARASGRVPGPRPAAD